MYRMFRSFFVSPLQSTKRAGFVSSVFGIISVAAVSGAQDAPSPRQAHGMAYDAESDRIILFGGDLAARPVAGTSSVVLPVGDTWSYDLNLSAWTNMNPAEAPSPRQGAGMAYDAESDRVVLFGGARPELSDATWVYDFNTNTWTEMNPETSPSSRVSVPGAMVYDAESDRVVLFGGRVGDILPGGVIDDVVDDETWTYDFNSNTWMKMEPETRPSPRTEPGMAYDAESDRVIVFGGVPQNDDTWAYDLNTNTWTLMEPAARPVPGHAIAMAYDAESDRVILFGAHIVPFSPIFSDETWAYDFNTNTWTKMEPPTKALARTGNAQAYDSESDRVVMFGGDTLPGRSGETWTYDFNTNTWTDLLTDIR